MPRQFFAIAAALIAAMLSAGAAQAAPKGQTIKGITAEGSCAVVGMSAEQSQLIALQRARSSAIEQAAGVKVASSTVITNMRLAVDFIRSYSLGYIVDEKVEWLPLGSYQKDSSMAPIPEYRVRIVADVYKPEKSGPPIGLTASLNRTAFRAGEKAVVKLRTGRDARIAIFNIMADDKVAMIFPNKFATETVISKGDDFIFPKADSGIELTLATLEGHKRDAEAVYIVAVDAASGVDVAGLFRPMEPMSLSGFFARLSKLADVTEDAMLAYEVTAEE